MVEHRTQGDTGSQGIQGIQGPKGDTGAQGIQASKASRRHRQPGTFGFQRHERCGRQHGSSERQWQSHRHAAATAPPWIPAMWWSAGHTGHCCLKGDTGSQDPAGAQWLSGTGTPATSLGITATSSSTVQRHLLPQKLGQLVQPGHAQWPAGTTSPRATRETWSPGSHCATGGVTSVAGRTGDHHADLGRCLGHRQHGRSQRQISTAQPSGGASGDFWVVITNGDRSQRHRRGRDRHQHHRNAGHTGSSLPIGLASRRHRAARDRQLHVFEHALLHHQSHCPRPQVDPAVQPGRMGHLLAEAGGR